MTTSMQSLISLTLSTVSTGTLCWRPLMRSSQNFTSFFLWLTVSIPFSSLAGFLSRHNKVLSKEIHWKVCCSVWLFSQYCALFGPHSQLASWMTSPLVAPNPLPLRTLVYSASKAQNCAWTSMYRNVRPSLETSNRLKGPSRISQESTLAMLLSCVHPQAQAPPSNPR